MSIKTILCGECKYWLNGFCGNAEWHKFIEDINPNSEKMTYDEIHGCQFGKSKEKDNG